jgi:MFS family permease
LGIKSAEDKTVIIISLITATCLLGNSMLYVTLPLYWQEVGLGSLWEVGIILSVNRIVRLPLNAVFGWLYSKISIRFAMTAAVVFATIATLGYGVLSGFWAWVLLRLSWGIAWSLLKLGGFFTVLTEAGQANRGRLMGRYNGLHRLGDLFGMMLGGYLTGVIGFRGTALLFGVIIALAIPIAALSAPRYKAPGAGSGCTTPATIKFSFPFIRVILGGMIIALLFEGAVASTLSLLIESHYKDGIVILGILVTVASLSGFLQGVRWLWEPFLAPFVGRWSDKRGDRGRLFQIFLLIGAFVFVIASIKLYLPLWLMVIVVLMLIATILVTLSDTLASDLAQDHSSIKTMTIYTIALDIGAAIGPIVSYQMLRLDSGLSYIYIMGAALLLSLAFLWRLPELSLSKKQA